MKKILENKTILITRNFEESEKEILLLKTNGAEVICFPANKIEKINNSEKIKSVLKKTDYINFSSVNAVKFFLENINYDISLIPQNVKFVAVGEKTKEYCISENLTPVEIPEKFSTEGLLEFYKKKNVNGKSFLLPSSSKARSELSDGLQNLGAEVFHIPVYETLKNNSDELISEIEKVSSGKIDLFGFTSPSNFYNFLELNNILEPQNFFNNKIISVIGDTTEKAISKKNVSVDLKPDKFTVHEMVKQIIKFYENRSDLE